MESEQQGWRKNKRDHERQKKRDTLARVGGEDGPEPSNRVKRRKLAREQQWNDDEYDEVLAATDELDETVAQSIARDSVDQAELDEHLDAVQASRDQQDFPSEPTDCDAEEVMRAIELQEHRQQQQRAAVEAYNSFLAYVVSMCRR